MMIRYLLAFCIVAVSSCASQPEHNRKLVFNTLIRESGLKLFEYRLLPSPQKNIQTSVLPPRRVVLQSPKEIKADLKYIKKRADTDMEELQFCRTGFWLIKSDVDERGSFIRGECNERATEEDRTKFPDSILRW